MICDGSSVLFADWPEFQQVYNEGRFTGMTLSEANPAQVGKLVLNGSSGVYLPDLEGLYEQASSAANAGGYLAAGLPNIVGGLPGVRRIDNLHTGASGALQWNVSNETAMTQTISGADIDADIIFNASLSSGVYGNSDTVQPPSVQYVRAMYLGKPNSAAA